MEFPLVTPFKSGATKVARLSIREPTVGDVEISDKEKQRLARMLRLLSLVAELSPDDLRRMATRDYVRLQELLRVFL